MKIFKRVRFIPFFSFILALVTAFTLAPDVHAIEDPAINTAAALLVDVDADTVLYAKNENEQRAPASLTKVMTVMLAIEAYDRGEVSLNDIVVVGPDVYFDITSDGSTANLKAGEELTFEQLLYCAMLQSANEACNVLAEFISGDVPTFLTLMNRRAVELGCANTHFANTHGMPNDSHYTTAHDLYLIVSNALDYSLFKRVVSTESYTVPATNMSEERELRNTNNLLREGSPYYYEYAAGVKTGSTNAAGYCLISTATKEGRTLISVVLGAQSVVIEDGTTQVQSFSETKRLFEWGFNNFSYQELLGTIDLIAEVPVELGYGADSVILRPKEGIRALLPNDVDLGAVKLVPSLYSSEPLVAPVETGTVLGEVAVSLNGVSYGTVELVANARVELDRAAYVRSEIKNTLANKYVRLAMIVLVALFFLYILYIVFHNLNRRKKRQAAAALARKRIEEYRRGEEASTGKSFEEIEAMKRDRDMDRAKDIDIKL